MTIAVPKNNSKTVKANLGRTLKARFGHIKIPIPNFF